MSLYDYESPYLAENELLKEHLRLLMEEMDARAQQSQAPGTPWLSSNSSAVANGLLIDSAQASSIVVWLDRPFLEYSHAHT
jgi:hypothetical protein